MMLHGFRKKILLLMVKLESSISTAIFTSRNYTMKMCIRDRGMAIIQRKLTDCDIISRAINESDKLNPADKDG